MKEYIAYIDETGDPDFNESASELFFMCAIVIENNLYDDYINTLNNIKKQYTISELKSASKLNHRQKSLIFEELLKLDFTVVSILVQKRRLSGDWFKNRKTFYKYIQRKLNYEIHRLYDNIQVNIHKYGSLQYQESLKTYLINSLQENLFEPSLVIVSHEIEPLIEVADFISGTLRKSIRSETLDNHPIFKEIKQKWNKRINIPTNVNILDTSFFETSKNSFDFCLKEAYRYLVSNSNREDQAKYKTLEYLYYSAFESPEQYVYTAEILNWLKEINLNYSEEQFRAEIISSLRQEGLIIVGTRKGLKIPTSIEDFLNYINFSTSMALPILKNLKRAITFFSAKTNVIDFNQLFTKEIKNILKEIDA